MSEIERELAKIKFEGKSTKFGRIIKKCYGKGYSWEFLPHIDKPDEVRLTLKEGRKIIFASNLGDGFRLGLSLLSKIFNKTNTCCFIEEIESHQNIGSLNPLLSALVEIARNNNLQLFITTHSRAVWNSISRGIYLDDEEREKKEFRCFIIERDLRKGIAIAEHTDDITKIDRVLGTP